MKINYLEIRLKNLDPILYGSLIELKYVIRGYLQNYKLNFEEFTDHSFEHVLQVAQNASDLLKPKERKLLNEDEIYILLMACYLHDVGMCIPKKDLLKYSSEERFNKYQEENTGATIQDFIREIHHEISYEFIVKRWKDLKIKDADYAQAIALVAKAHRKVNLLDFNEFKPQFWVRPTGNDSVCLPYLGCLVRMADEMDITYLRIPDILFKDYLPDNKKSREEWIKHKNTFGINVSGDKLLYRANATDKNVYTALTTNFEKVSQTLTYCHKVFNMLPSLLGRRLCMDVKFVENKIEPKGFIPKDIGFSFNLKGVFDTFIKRDIYYDKYDTLREALTNAIDSCNYKKSLISNYKPEIEVNLFKNEDCKYRIIIKDNGMGMNEFIVSNFFSKLASNNYYDDKIGFQPIGQFGVGVFSYFMIADYFEVNTKMADNDPLYFRIFKNQEVDFYFFDNNYRKESGTEIVLYLNEEVNKEINYDLLISKIQHHIRFIEFPINVKFESQTTCIKKKHLAIKNDKVILSSLINFGNENEMDKLSIEKFKFNNELFEGQINLLLGSKKTNYSPVKVMELCRNRTTVNELRNEVSQKGIFVSSFRENELFINNTFGEINIKKKVNLMLNRRSLQVEDPLVSEMIDKVNDRLLTYIFQLWKSLTKKQIYFQCANLIQFYLREYSLISNFNVLAKNLYVLLYNKRSFQIELLSDVLKKYSKFALYTVDEYKKRVLQPVYNKENINRKVRIELKKIWDQYTLPIFFCTTTKLMHFYAAYFAHQDFNVDIKFSSNRIDYILDANTKGKIIYQFGLALEQFDNNDYLACSTYSIFGFRYSMIGVGILFNSSHPLILKYFEYKSNSHNRIKELEELFDLFFRAIDGVFQSINNGYGKFNDAEISKLNILLSHIEKYWKLDYQLSRKDFPGYYCS